MSTRRTFIQKAAGFGAGILAASRLSAESTSKPASLKQRPARPSAIAFKVPVVTTDIGDLPFTMDGNTKVFRLVAEVIRQQINPMKSIRCLGIQWQRAWADNSGQPGRSRSRNFRKPSARANLDALARFRGYDPE